MASHRTDITSPYNFSGVGAAFWRNPNVGIQSEQQKEDVEIAINLFVGRHFYKLYKDTIIRALVAIIDKIQA
jgi:hypothetical protein